MKMLILTTTRTVVHILRADKKNTRRKSYTLKCAVQLIQVYFVVQHLNLSLHSSWLVSWVEMHSKVSGSFSPRLSYCV